MLKSKLTADMDYDDNTEVETTNIDLINQTLIDKDENKDDKRILFKRILYVVMILISAVVVIVFVKTVFFKKKFDKETNPVTFDGHPCCQGFVPKIYPELPVVNEKQSKIYKDYLKNLIENITNVTFSDKLAGQRFIAKQDSCEEILKRYSIQVPQEKAPFTSHKHLVCDFMRMPYDGDGTKSFISATSKIIQENVDLYKTHEKLSQMEFNLHVVPHSHTDLGWLKTYKEYSQCEYFPYLCINFFRDQFHLQQCHPKFAER